MAELIVKIKPEDVADRVLDEITYKGKTLREWDDTLTNPRSNADRIRAMSDEELAERFSKQDWWNCPPTGTPCRGGLGYGCTACWLDWLKSPVEDAE